MLCKAKGPGKVDQRKKEREVNLCGKRKSGVNAIKVMGEKYSNSEEANRNKKGICATEVSKED